MTLPPSGPGKTAPKLHQDIFRFDPLKTGRGNVLKDNPPPVGEGPQPSPAIGSCSHDYTIKRSQSVTPPLDLRPDGRTKYKLALVCKKCRIHTDVKIDYTRATNPCPNSDYPVHHFQPLDEDVVTGNRISYSWQCSAPQCQAHLQISYRMARISDKEKDLLTNTELLRRRYETLVATEPEREGLRQAVPMEALSRLKKYTSDALKPDRSRDSFPANNKRFQEAFGVEGQDCHSLLTRLGFKYAVS
jgi:ubiquitin carboxyl-terminal hydrolase 25